MDNNNDDGLKISKSFKQSVRLVIISIFIFLLAYIVLLGIAGGLAIAAFYFGILLVSIKINFYTIIAGLGLISLGVMFFFFLIKFLFSVTKDENLLRIEIKESEEPKLFEFLRDISKQTNTKFPARVFVSPEVNAYVFYNSSFWSLIFPVKKNLNIGLGLINSVNIEEFKAIIAHEYGHFSQKSMALGSYVYVVNKSIYNMVYEYDYWDRLIEQWANAGGIFGFFAHITYALAEAVRFILKIAYNLININYLKLSREMEYHADDIAAYIAGKNNLINSLRKLDFTSLAYDHSLNILNNSIEENKGVENLYDCHDMSIQFLAKINDIEIVNNQLIISDEVFASKLIKSRVNIKDMWASHPSLIERKNNVERLRDKKVYNNESAWNLFKDKNQLSINVTKQLYEVGIEMKGYQYLSKEDYFEQLNNKYSDLTISEIYNSYYDNRSYPIFNNDELKDDVCEYNSLNDLYNKQKVERMLSLFSNEKDLYVLEQIKLKTIKAKTFEFDGVKYKRREVKKIIENLKKEVSEEEHWLINEDKKAFLYHRDKAIKCGKIEEFYSKLNLLNELQKDLEGINEIFYLYNNKREILYSTPRWSEDKWNSFVHELSNLENRLRKYLKTINFDLFDGNYNSEKQKTILMNYINNKFFYVSTNNFSEQNFIDLFDLISMLNNTISNTYLGKVKDITDFQLSID